MRFLSSIVLLLGTLAVAAPLDKRRSGTKSHMRSGTAVVQWTSNNGAVNTLRNYHISSSGTIMESRRSSDGAGWETANTGLKARVDGPLVAGLHKLSEARDDVEIRLFYHEPKVWGRDEETNLARYRQISAVWRLKDGWQVDKAFYDHIGYIATPQAIVTWVENNVVQWRMYFLSSSTGRDWSWTALAMNALGDFTNPYVLHSFNTVYEARYPSPSNGGWTIGNGGNGLATSQHMLSDTGAVAAAVWAKGKRISVMYWDTNSVNDNAKPGEIKEVRWKTGEGWVHQSRPNNDWKNFSREGALAMVTWVDGSGVDQLRLYVKWSRDIFLGLGADMVEFAAGANGWGKQSKDFPGFAVDDTRPYSPMSAVAWTYPNPNNVHIRVHQIKISSKDVGAAAWVREFTFDTDKGWKDGQDID